jgi:hypothetical protein
MSTASASIDIGEFNKEVLTKLLKRQWPLDIYKPKTD